VKDVAASLHVSTREVVRMAEQRIIPAAHVRGEWRFRAGEVWNWIEANLHGLPARRARDRFPEPAGDRLIEPVLRPSGIVVDLAARTKASLIRELARLAESNEPAIDAAELADAVMEREKTGSTALQDGVAVPHPGRPIYVEGPLIVAARCVGGLPFGERGGGLTDLFFLLCCPTQVLHLLYFGRLCRLLIAKDLQRQLREAEDSDAFCSAVVAAERKLCAGG